MIATRERPSAISSAVSTAMRNMPEKSTGPEMAIRRLLYRMGFRYRIHYPVPEKRRRSIDIAFPAQKVAVFIDGCFWHGCSEHRSIPAHNRDWWQDKIDQNRWRDRDTDTKLNEAGWVVCRFWEHESVERVVVEVVKIVDARKSIRSRHGKASS